MAKNKFPSKNNDLTAGIIILAIGGVLLLKAMGFWFPGWFFSWPMIFIAIGIVSLIKHNFQSGFGVVMLLFGSFFLVKKELGIPIEIQPFLIPIGLIVLGIFLILKRNNDRNRFSDDFFKTYNKSDKPFGTSTEQTNAGFAKPESIPFTNNGDTINAQALFTGIQKRVLSKNFMGGKISAIFGGTDIDLSQADLADGAIINIEVAFGGVKLIVPPHWDLQINVTNVFAGIEDKRMYPQTATDGGKVLRIYGSIIFGGLEIKSF
jgi:predicted membrane protein